MFSHNHAKNWNPYTIPATPNIASGSSDVYSLCCEEGSDGEKNPSQFLKWKLGLPKGDELGDLLYWDPAKGEDGGWVILAAPKDKGSILYWTGSAWQFIEPPSGSTLHVLTAQSGNLAWTATQDC